ncbi:low affinity iron permease family protein [Pseudomonas akapageensis]|uniref:low affinity iron permease family protein n=1 Tax=Pseudomonas akapageensis TaxID=2609961 RepID=UPI001407DDD7|nr:low affinity iron permease family protein [Pseudomonas akapageensis]
MKFSKFSETLSKWTGNAHTFQVALALIFIWGLSGPWFHFNDTWQLIINTSTTIITFLMVFIIQNTQNRDNDILHIKIDELLRVTKEAQNATLDLEDLGSEELKTLRDKYESIGAGEAMQVNCADRPVKDRDSD